MTEMSNRPRFVVAIPEVPTSSKSSPPAPSSAFPPPSNATSAPRATTPPAALDPLLARLNDEHLLAQLVRTRQEMDRWREMYIDACAKSPKNAPMMVKSIRYYQRLAELMRLELNRRGLPV